MIHATFLSTLLADGWDIVLGTWPLLAVAGALWPVLLATALRRIASRRSGGYVLALLAGGWAVATALAVEPALAHAALSQAAAGAVLALLAGALGFGLLSARSSSR
jgi:hypothetical protein